MTKIFLLIATGLMFMCSPCLAQSGDTLNFDDVRLVDVEIQNVSGSKIYRDFVLTFRLGWFEKVQMHSISAQTDGACIQKGNGCCLCEGKSYSFRLVRVCNQEDSPWLNEHGNYFSESAIFGTDHENCLTIKLDSSVNPDTAPYEASIFDWYYVVIGDRLYYVDALSPCCKYDRHLEHMGRECPCI